MFEAAGLPHADRLDKIPNSRKALMVAELARDRGRLDELHPRLFESYWVRGRDLGDERVLVDEGQAVGLDEAEIIDALQNAAYLNVIESATQAALDVGAGGVPAWIIDRRVLVPGAQPHDIFEQVLERLGHTARES